MLIFSHTICTRQIEHCTVFFPSRHSISMYCIPNMFLLLQIFFILNYYNECMDNARAEWGGDSFSDCHCTLYIHCRIAHCVISQFLLSVHPAVLVFKLLPLFLLNIFLSCCAHHSINRYSLFLHSCTEYTVHTKPFNFHLEIENRIFRCALDESYRSSE